MSPAAGSERASACAYEAVFCIFLAVLAYLGRENANLVYPAILYLFVLLLSLNLAAILALRRWPSKEWVSALIILANCGVIAAILSYSGGARSNLWVLYLLPIYTAALLLQGRETALIAAGAVGCSTLFYLVSVGAWNAAAVFELCLKDGLFVFSAALTWRLASAERLSALKLLHQRRELERLEETSRVQAARGARNEKLAEVGLSSAGIVHDLKNPLMVIRGYAEICLKERVLDPDVKGDVERIMRSADFCSGLVAQILRAANDEEAPRVSCEIHQRLEAAIELGGGVYARSGIEIQRRFSARPLRVLAAPEQLDRLFANLMGNAAKAMPGGGKLTLRTRACARGDGFSRAQVIVEDTGTGLSDEALAKLFKPFGTTRAREGGTGLGLYLCRDIAVKNGGSLEAENVPAAGARFILSLPLEPEGAPSF